MTERTADVSDLPWPSKGQAWWAVLVLLLVYAVSYVNRVVPAILIAPIKEDLGLSDTQISLLIGLAFVVFYAVMALPIARIGDRANRQLIIAVAIPIWSGAMIYSAFAESFLEVFCARIVLGFGEATIGPLSLSIIADYFPPKRRSRPVSAWYIGAALGTAGAFIIGGLSIPLAQMMNFGPMTDLAPWRVTFFSLGLVGLPLLVLVFTVKEPVRREAAVDHDEKTASLAETLQYLRKRMKTFAAFFAVAGLANVFTGGASIWFPTLFIRIHGWSDAKTGAVLGIVIVLVGICGPLVASWLNDIYRDKGRRDAPLQAAYVMLLFAILPATVGPLLENPSITVVLMVPMIIGVTGASVLPSVAVLEVVPNAIRAQVTAIFFFITSILAYGVGPTLYAATTDYILGDENLLHISMAILGFALCGGGLLLLRIGMPRYRRDLALADQPSSADQSQQH